MKRREHLSAIRGLPILASDKIAALAERLTKIGRAIMVSNTDALIAWQLFDQVAAEVEAAKYEAGMLYVQALRGWRRHRLEDTEPRAEKWWAVAAALIEVVRMDRSS